MNFDFLNRLQPFAQLVMRLVLGAIMISHGYHKVWGGFHHHMDMVGSLGLPAWMAYLSAGTEFFGGIGIRSASTPSIEERSTMPSGWASIEPKRTPLETRSAP